MRRQKALRRARHPVHPYSHAIALALSLGGNAYQFHRNGVLIAEGAKTEQARVDTLAAATTCSSSVDALAAKSGQQAAGIRAALIGIAPAVSKAQGEAIRALAAKPNDPNDLCKSLSIYLKAQIQGEGGGK